MLALPAFRSFFSLARAVRMSLARLSASIRWSSDLSGAAAEVLTGAGMWAASIAAARGRARGCWPISAKFTSTSTRGRGTRRLEIERSDSSAATAIAGPRVAEALGPDRDQGGPGGDQLERVGAARRPLPCRRSAAGSRRRRRASARPRSAAPPGRRGRRGPAAMPGPAGGRIDRARLQRVDQRDRVGAALLGGDGDRGGVGDVRASASRSAASRSAAAAPPAAPPSRPAARRRSAPSGRWGRRR